MTKKQRVLNNVRDWIDEMPKDVAANHHVDRIASHYGVDLQQTLEKMSYAELSVLLCLIVGQNAKAHGDSRKWAADRKARNEPCEVVQLRLVK